MHAVESPPASSYTVNCESDAAEVLNDPAGLVTKGDRVSVEKNVARSQVAV
jgi:hypothetical protein